MGEVAGIEPTPGHRVVELRIAADQRLGIGLGLGEKGGHVGQVVLAVGETREMSGEAESRSTLDLPGKQEDLIRAVVDAAHNAVLGELFATFVPRLRRAMVAMVDLDRAGEAHRHDQDAHEAILDAVRARDAARASAAARDHLGAVHAKVAGSGRP